MKRIIILACLLAPVVVLQCSGSDSTAIDGGSDATLGDASSDSANDAPVVSDASDASAVDAAIGCDAGCRACCRQANPDAGAIIRHDEMVCGCSKPGSCEAGTLCGDNLCMDKKETLACVACLDNGDAGDCTQKALAKCALQPECAALEACILACGDGG